jgi:hypothetical protein
MLRLLRNQAGWWCALTVVTLVLAAGEPALAQTDVTTSRISGTVSGADGAPLPGVTVEATNQETDFKVSGVTDAQGFYRLLNLPTGAYRISAALEGFNTATRPDVQLLLGSTPTVNFKLQLASVSESITVTSSSVPVVESTNTTFATTIQAEQIKNLPVPGRDFRQLVLATPETRFDSERGNLSISGQRGINTNVTVDGVDYNDPFFGGTVGAAEGRAPLSLSQESIKEFTVITNGASVEFGRSGGGFVNVITKSGTNVLHGSGFYYNQPQSLISNFANGQKPADQKKEQYGASLGGPLWKDRLFYFLSYDKQNRDVTIPISGNVLDPDIFARYPQLASGPQYVQTQNGSVLFGRVDAQLADGQRLLVRANQAKYTGVNGTNNTPSVTQTYNGIEGLDSKSIVGSYSGVFGPNFLNDLNLNYVHEDTPRADKGLNLPAIFLGSASYGEVSFLPITSTTKRKAAGDTLTFLHGDHVIKGGAEYNDTGIDQVFRGNWRGVFVFNSKADLLAGRWFEYRQFGGLNGLSSTQAGRANFGQKETAAFAQDQWFVRPNLTVTAGLRWENLNNPNDPVLNPADRNPDGSYKLNAQIPDSNNQVSPRLSVSWAPDPKTAVRGSIGRYWSRTPAILFAQLLTSNGLRATQYVVDATTDSTGKVIGPPTNPLAPGWGTGFVVNGVERIDFTKVSAVPQPGVFAIDPNFKDPYTDRVTIGAEREIFARTTLAVDVVYAESKQLERLTDTNKVYDGTTSVNGVPHYARTRPDPFYGRITTLVSDARSKYQAVTATLTRRFASRFSLYGAVTYSIDKDNDSNERNFAGIQAEDFNNLDLNYGYSNRDQRWKAIVNGVWDTPWWGIGLSGVLRFTTGSPYTATTNVDFNGDGISNTDRPTVGGVHFARNSFRQPSFYSLDLRVSKSFNLGPGQLSPFIECFNCTNASNLFVTNTTWGPLSTPAATFGKDAGQGTPRTFQVALRYDF